MLHIGSVAIFPAKVYSHNENPDRYAAAICIRVRADVCCADILSAKLPPVHVAKRLADLRLYPDASFLLNRYFFFFLAVFLAVFFAFFAFLAMLPSVIPKVASMQVGYRRALNSQYTTIAKLILRPSKRVNDRHTVTTWTTPSRETCPVSE